MQDFKISESDFTKTVVREHFATPGACYDALVQRYGGADRTLEDRPKYLFRGEARYYPTSTSGTYRALMAADPMGIKYARIDATWQFVDDYEEADGDRDIGECLAQHYLSTSDGLDFSASLGVALAFALGEDDEAPRSAYIAVLDRQLADSSDRFFLRDLSELVEARRPVRQCGFVAVHHAGNFVDLKDSECRRKLGLDWYSFTVALGDVGHTRHSSAPCLDVLYDIRDDPWAAKMIEHLDCLISNPKPLGGEEGLRHLIGSRKALLSRTGSQPRHRADDVA
jgi:hypothetical protein